MKTSSAVELDYAQAIASIVATMPIERRAQVYEYVMFLQSRQIALDPQVQEEIDETWWQAQFEATDSSKLAAFISSALAEGEDTGISLEDDKLTPSTPQNNR